MDRKELYEKMAVRKDKPKDYEPYAGDNGRVNKCAALIKSGQLRSGGTLIDVGGGIGDLGYAVKDLFDIRCVIDICDKSNNAAIAKGNIAFTRDVDKEGLFGMTDNAATLVTALDFIEHIIDPENFARECYRVLELGGEVFINTPNIRFWKHIEQLWKQGRFPHTSGDREVYHGGHLAFYTLNDLKEIFSAAGFLGCMQFVDEECYVEPPRSYIECFDVRTQWGFKSLQMEFGCPNLLFRAQKR